LRLGDLTPRKLHYQTGLVSPVNHLQGRRRQRQFTATSAWIAQASVDAPVSVAGGQGSLAPEGFFKRDPFHIMARRIRGRASAMRLSRLTFGHDGGLVPSNR